MHLFRRCVTLPVCLSPPQPLHHAEEEDVLAHREAGEEHVVLRAEAHVAADALHARRDVVAVDGRLAAGGVVQAWKERD